MGSCCSTHTKSDVIQQENIVINVTEIQQWNERREDILKNLEGLTELYASMDTRNERIKLIEQNIEIFKEFFNLPNIDKGLYEQIEYMFQVGLPRYIKPPK